MTSAYLTLPRRSLAAVLAARLEPGDRVTHPAYGKGRIGSLITGPRPVAVVRFDDGTVKKIAAEHLQKLAP